MNCKTCKKPLNLDQQRTGYCVQCNPNTIKSKLNPIKINPSSSLGRRTVHCSTTPEIPGENLIENKGVVCGNAIMGANLFRDLFAAITDVVGGRSHSYESTLGKGRKIAMAEMMEDCLAKGGNAVVGVSIDYETIGKSMLMICTSGTAVITKPKIEQVVAGNPLGAPQSKKSNENFNH